MYDKWYGKFKYLYRLTSTSLSFTEQQWHAAKLSKLFPAVPANTFISSLLVSVSLNLVNKMFFLRFTSSSAILKKSDRSTIVMFCLSSCMCVCVYCGSFSCSNNYITAMLVLLQDQNTVNDVHRYSKSKEHSCISRFLFKDEVKR